MSASRRIIIKAGLKMGADTLMDEREREGETTEWRGLGKQGAN